MRIVTACTLALALLPAAAHATVWNLADDFSATQNPNGAWSFGWRATSSQPFTPFADTSPYPSCPPDPNVHVWSYQPESTYVSVCKNANDHVWSCNGCDYPANVVWFHPGDHPGREQQSVVRWTAPSDMQIALAAHFLALDTGSSLVHVYFNGAEMFSATLPYFGATAADSLTTFCHAGDIIDIAIDAISFTDDSVKLDVVIGPPVGACCFPLGACLQGTATDCAVAGGRYIGDGVPCDPYPCGTTAVSGTTWGLVKTLYR